MRRISIVGSSGSGKSTFGKKLSDILGIEYYELDSLFWKPNWVQSDNEEFFSKVESIVKNETWIIDGNYKRVNNIKYLRSDTIIWIDTPFIITIVQAFKRAIIRIKNKEELWEGTGNRETFKKTFFSKDSILLWTLTHFFEIKKRYKELFISENYSHINFIRLKTRKEKNDFLNNIKIN